MTLPLAVSNLRGQVQAADAGVMALEVLPEPAGQGRGKLPQAAVIQRGLPLLQVVHQQVADWPAGQVVTVDQLTGRALARAVSSRSVGGAAASKIAIWWRIR